MSHISKLNEETANHLEDIYDFARKRWRDGIQEKKPSKLSIVSDLINGIWDQMVEDGEISG